MIKVWHQNEELFSNSRKDQGKISMRSTPKMRYNVVYFSIVHLGRLRSCQDGLSNHLLELPKTFDAEDESDGGRSLDSSLFPDKENGLLNRLG